MAEKEVSALISSIFLFLLFPHFSSSLTYIIHVSPSLRPSTSPTPFHWYSCTLRSLPRPLRRPAARILYTYDRVVSGFAARISSPQAASLRLLPHVLAVVPDTARFPHTTRTPSFLGLSPSFGIWPQSSFASSTVIAVLDTGIFPYSRSFFDPHLPPPPSSFHPSCAFINSSSSPCNDKLIGAKFFSKGYESALGHPINETLESKSPLDTEGHGTHTSSTAAGASVPCTGLLGFASGEATGIAPRARIAVYKICWAQGCFDSDILAAMDAAVADGADIISLSVGAVGPAPDYFADSIAVGAFGATRNGVVVSCSAGNSGPGPYTTVNIAPWIITVGASTIDREFPANVVLGDGTLHRGASLYAGLGNVTTADLPLVDGAGAGSRLCVSGFLDTATVAGKIVLCHRGKTARVEKGSAVKLAGGVGMILINTDEIGDELIADAHLIPATMVSASSGERIQEYIASSPSPTATIFFSGNTVFGNDPSAPKVAAFSSRGPSSLTLEILKPDVISPGVNILAAWTGATSPTDLADDPRRVEYNIISGTSMACPHVSGVAALLREAHHDWSPAAIKSAIMTTAYNHDNTGKTIQDLATGKESTPFDRGAGHVDPNEAINPGLIYDAGIEDYVAFLCSINYTAAQIAVFTGDEGGTNCSKVKEALASPGDLNYPSFSVLFSDRSSVVSNIRTVKNVGGLDCGPYGSCKVVYDVEIGNPPGVKVEVKPRRLVFDSVNQSLSYEITFTSYINGTTGSGSSHQFGWICWSDGDHKVRSPIAIMWRQSELVSSM